MASSEPGSRSQAPRAGDFRQRLRADLLRAERQGLPFLDVSSRQLHQAVGGYPSEDNRMPACCKVMHTEMKAGDQVLASPPSGLGATLVVRYRLPRS